MTVTVVMSFPAVMTYFWLSQIIWASGVSRISTRFLLQTRWWNA